MEGDPVDVDFERLPPLEEEPMRRDRVYYRRRRGLSFFRFLFGCFVILAAAALILGGGMFLYQEGFPSFVTDPFKRVQALYNLPEQLGEMEERLSFQGVVQQRKLEAMIAELQKQFAARGQVVLQPPLVREERRERVEEPPPVERPRRPLIESPGPRIGGPRQ